MIQVDIKQFMKIEGEKPLDVLKDDGGFCSIFRTIGCVGDSLSSGEFESLTKDGVRSYHDMYEYSWGQYMARAIGSKVYNFSRGGMSAKWYCENFAEENGFWDFDKRCQAYIFALGVNDISKILAGDIELGSIEDVDKCYLGNNKNTFAGYYAKIIQRLKTNQPQAKFFLMTIPRSDNTTEERDKLEDKHRELLYKMAELFENTYVLDFRQYAPLYDAEFRKNFFMSGHMTPTGYVLTAKMVMSYIDYIIRNNPADFAEVGFIGTPWVNVTVKEEKNNG